MNVSVGVSLYFSYQPIIRFAIFKCFLPECGMFSHWYLLLSNDGFVYLFSFFIEVKKQRVIEWRRERNAGRETDLFYFVRLSSLLLLIIVFFFFHLLRWQVTLLIFVFNQCWLFRINSTCLEVCNSFLCIAGFYLPILRT